MSRNWTENQHLAIEARGGSVLVSAAAGSGKTAVLVERVIRMVTDSQHPVPIDRLLIVTYTRAAAAELRERISSSLNKLIAENPHNNWYRRQLIHLPYASISTVDSFCSDLVREHFQSLKISSDFRIADNGELAILKQEAMALTLDEQYANADDSFLQLVESFSSHRDDTKLQSNILRLYEFLRSHPFADKWLEEKLSYYRDATDAAHSVWGEVILRYALSATEYSIELTENSLKLLEQEPELYSKVCDLFSSDLKYLKTLKNTIKDSTWDDISSFASTFVTGRMNARGYTDHPLKLRVASNRDIVKDTVKLIISLFARSEQECLEDIHALYPLVQAMFECIKLFDKNYSELKLHKNVADFSDIEHWALELLVTCDAEGNVSETPLAKVVSDRFDAVMVDEYQDANEVQDLLFNSVSHRGQNLFVVGDVKQSIYGFRQAMPEIFLGRKNTLPLYNPNLDNYPAKIILERNFRSRSEVTDFINFVFNALMSEETGDLEYTAEEELVPAASYPEADKPCTELHILDLDAIDEDMDAAVAEARHIASVIHRMCSDTYITDNGNKRLVNFGDVAVLMRNLSRYADVYVSELMRCGVPAVCETSSGLLSSHEIKIAVNFLRVIDSPVQDIPLLSVMMSPVYGFTPDDMAEIRACNRRSPLYVSVRDYAQQGDIKAQSFLSDIDELRDLSLTLPSDLFIGALYEHTGLLSVSVVTGGELAVNNLRLLVEYATAFEKGASKGISAFVAYLDKLEREGTDISAATGSNADAYNAVRIMSIHSSKGLEFPVCILANTARKFITDTSENVLLHSKLGFACKRRDDELMCTYTTMPRDAVSLEVARSEKSEELRVLYVAMTRAKEHLVMMCTRKGLRSYLSKLSASLAGGSKISPYVVRDCKNLSDWLVMCAMMHPQGEKLRDFAGVEPFDSYACEDNGNFSIHIIDSLEINQTGLSGQVISHIIYDSVPENVGEIIKSRFDYEYPYKELCTLPQKVTASELAHKDSEKHFDRRLVTPAFMSDLPLSPTERGTAMHLFLEHCDFSLARQDITAEIARLSSLGILTDKQTQVLDINRLQSFLSSDIITTALEFGEYYREYRFTVNIPACLVDDNISSENKNYPVILQGSVDLAIITKDGIIIVDYKTDRVKESSQLVEMYKKQLKLYKVALEQTMSKPVVKTLIYSVHLSETTEVML